MEAASRTRASESSCVGTASSCTASASTPSMSVITSHHACSCIENSELTKSSTKYANADPPPEWNIVVFVVMDDVAVAEEEDCEGEE